ncbi:hypothetical protein SG34_008470 [Thalassomonas viridans]|uniref:KfrA N-terminal DNA-binding domain-containing protein n=1 Tax=Thalassomonas viridans TaxID=137584 RepID=A0AAE9Z599_9GAMM|nr:hypothetical protein [Thalassomonas viridans]WDE06910.1 hypothetical protein SG34_008470 [Thalassomonas viridans]
MTIREEILTIANQLANQGKSPSVALIKTKLSAPTPLPVIISTLKSWQHDPDYIKVKASDDNSVQKPAENTALEQEVQQAVRQALQQELAPLRSELAEVKALLQALTAKDGQ